MTRMTRKFAALLERVEELERRVSTLESGADEEYMGGYGAEFDGEVLEAEDYEGYEGLIHDLEGEVVT